jgi:hypothetical protein
MENKISKVIGFCAMGLILLVSSILILRWILDFLDWARFAPGDLATWLGAIGTISAFFGTIYIARTETRRRERGERALAQLHAAAWIMRLIHAKSAMDHVINILDSASMAPTDVTFAFKGRAILERISVWSVNDLVPLATLPDNTAKNLARAITYIDGMRKVFDNEILKAEQFTDESRQNIATTFAGSFRTARPY